MSKNKYLGTVSAVALLFMLLSFRAYYNSFVWSDIFWIITGVPVLLAGGFTAFAAAWATKTGKKLLLHIGVAAVLCVTLMIWAAYWADYDVYASINDEWLYASYGFYAGYGYADTAISNIVTVLGFGGAYAAGALLPEAEKRQGSALWFFGGLGMCAALYVLGDGAQAFYVTIAVCLALGIMFFRTFTRFGRVPLIVLFATAWLACLTGVILEMAVGGYEFNFALMTVVVCGIVLAVFAVLADMAANRPAALAAKSSAKNRFEELAALRKLKDEGILSEEEFQTEKKKILGE